MPVRIVLIGLSGTGKSTVAALLARRLGWAAADTDAILVEMTGREIADIFANDGEPHFRALEREAVRAAARGEQVVIATGGGAVLDPANRELLWRDSHVVWLDARTETLVARLASGDDRPLVPQGDDRAVRIEELRAQRRALYALAHDRIEVDDLTPEAVAEAIDAGVAVERGDPSLAAWVATPGGAYPAYAGWGVLERLPDWMREAGLSRTVHVVADEPVAELHGEALLGALRSGGLEPVMHALPLQEANKTLATAEQIYDRLVERRAERNHVLLAFGGGVATDLGGYVAATYLRGMPLVQAPTSLLGMVDAAIGGKVAVNHREGKNLIGAFYQPRLVIADAALLTTLPPRELTGGWGEVIKHALITDLELLGWLEDEADALLRLDPEPAARMLRRNIAIKAAVVSADERESGLRMTLNYGHTIGHALEAATGYGTLLHGEAVAVGMVAAAHIGRTLGLLTPDEEARQNRLIARYGLPQRAPGVPVEAVLGALSLDKKVSGKTNRWIMLDGLGRTVIRDDVPLTLVREAVELVTGDAASE